jgi:hypothetical protein
MMPYFFCGRCGGPLLTLPARYQAVLPRFALGQTVRSHFTDDQGFYHGCDRGVVVGVQVVHEGLSSEPLYSIWWLEMPTAPYIDLPHVSGVLESDLEAD